MTDPYSARPALSLLVTLPIVAVAATAFVLTAERLPRPVVHETSTRTEQCVMFCAAAEKPTPTQQPDSGSCLMFCNEKPWRAGDLR